MSLKPSRRFRIVRPERSGRMSGPKCRIGARSNCQDLGIGQHLFGGFDISLVELGEPKQRFCRLANGMGMGLRWEFKAPTARWIAASRTSGSVKVWWAKWRALRSPQTTSMSLSSGAYLGSRSTASQWALGERSQRGFADMDRAVVEHENGRLEGRAGLGAVEMVKEPPAGQPRVGSHQKSVGFRLPWSAAAQAKWSNQSEPSEDARLLGRKVERVGCGLAGGDRAAKGGNVLMHQMLEERRQRFRGPRDRRTRLISEARPIRRDHVRTSCKAFHERVHLAPCRNGTQRWKQQHRRAGRRAEEVTLDEVERILV